MVKWRLLTVADSRQELGRCCGWLVGYLVGQLFDELRWYGQSLFLIQCSQVGSDARLQVTDSPTCGDVLLTMAGARLRLVRCLGARWIDSG